MNQLECLYWIINMEEAYTHDVSVFASYPTRSSHVQSRRHVQHLSHVRCTGWEHARVRPAESHLTYPNVDVDSHIHAPFCFGYFLVEELDVRPIFMIMTPHILDSAILRGSNLPKLSAGLMD